MSAVVESLEPRCLLAAGALDPSFGVGGMVTTNFLINDLSQSVTIQNDGKIVVTGTVRLSFAVLRFNTDGSLDTSFDGDGMVTTVFGTGNDVAKSAVLQTDGRIIVAGYAGFNNRVFALARLNTDGSLDTTFDGDGMVTTAFGGRSAEANAVALQSDGRIVVVGNTFNGTRNEFAVSRYNTDGSLDVTFDGDGRLTTSFAGTSDIASSVVLQSDGKIIVGGKTREGNSFDLALVRYNTDGSLDTSFDGDGKLVTPFHGPISLVLQPDGRIFVSGTTGVRLNADGSTDTSFAALSFNAHGAVLQSDGRIVVAGDSNSAFAVARFNADGSLDTTFDGDGIVTTPFGGTIETARGVAIQRDGKIVLAGNTYGPDLGARFALARYANRDTSPEFTSSASPSLPEKTRTVLTIAATNTGFPTQTVTFSLTGGADQGNFSISTTGVLTFVTAPDFGAPTDANADNVYLVQVTASDGNGGTATQDIAVTVVQNVRVYRAYNPNANFHFLTTRKSEFDNAVVHGWRDEAAGRAGFAVIGSPVMDASPLYRLYNLQRGFHYYTLNPVERNSLINLVPPPPPGQPDLRTTGWRDEGIEGYMYPAAHDGATTIYRMYNTDSGTHLLTDNPATRDAILAITNSVTGAHPWQRHSDVGFAFSVPAGSAPAQASALSHAVRVARAAAGNEFLGPEGQPDTTSLNAQPDQGLSSGRIASTLHESAAQRPSFIAPASSVRSAPNAEIGLWPMVRDAWAIRREAPPRMIADELSVDQFWEQLSHGSEMGLERLFGSPA